MVIGNRDNTERPWSSSECYPLITGNGEVLELVRPELLVVNEVAAPKDKSEGHKSSKSVDGDEE